MYARLRQKTTVSLATTLTDRGLGTNSLSLLMKDIARLITGQITSTSQLNPDIWDTTNSEIVSDIAPGWTEYQTSFSNSSTNITSGASNIMYFRCPSMNVGDDGQTYKYIGIGISNNTTTAAGHKWNLFNAWDVTDFVGNPTLSFKSTAASTTDSLATDGRNAFLGNTLSEYIIYASPSAIIVTGTYFATSVRPVKVCAFLEYPSSVLSKTYNLPNQVFWEHSYSGSSSKITTGSGGSFVILGYMSDITLSSGDIFSSGVINANIGYVYTSYSGVRGWTSLWDSNTAPTAMSTLKPATFTAMSNTVDQAGNTVGVPVMPLIYFPRWDTVYDLSSLTGVYATKTSAGANGDSITINGTPYAYINATNMGYLIPKQ